MILEDFVHVGGLAEPADRGNRVKTQRGLAQHFLSLLQTDQTQLFTKGPPTDVSEQVIHLALRHPVRGSHRIRTDVTFNLLPLLQDTGADWDHAAFTTLSPGNHSLRHQNWRYTIYQDGSEELYDLDEDPNEWRNLASDPAQADILNRYRAGMHAQFLGAASDSR